jgi:hypothetical protein
LPQATIDVIAGEKFEDWTHCQNISAARPSSPARPEVGVDRSTRTITRVRRTRTAGRAERWPGCWIPGTRARVPRRSGGGCRPATPARLSGTDPETPSSTPGRRGTR